MIRDITGTVLIPGNRGWDCPGNGLHPGAECCCDECDYFLCCMEEQAPDCGACATKLVPVRNPHLTTGEKCAILIYTRRCGGIGRHQGLKIPCCNRRTGSSPVSGTKKREAF